MPCLLTAPWIARHGILGLCVLAAASPGAPAPAAPIVDTALVGTWRLEWTGAPVFWAVRQDGTYRLHGPGAASRQFGTMESGKGRWSIQSATWADGGTYRTPDPTTWVVTGKVGTGTWKRVWTPAEGSPGAASGVGACRLVTPSEAARALFAPAAGQPDIRAGDDGCVFRSLLSTLDQVSIGTRRNVSNFFQNLRKSRAASAIDVPGVGDQAYAEVGPGSALTLQFLKGGSWVTLRLGLQPTTGVEDVPYLAELARAAAGRL